MMKEVPVEVAKEGDAAGVKAGDRVMVDIFSDEKFVDVIGTSKGRGFAGASAATTLAAGPRRTGTCFRCRVRSARPPFRREYSRPTHAGPHGARADYGAQPAHPRHRS